MQYMREMDSAVQAFAFANPLPGTQNPAALHAAGFLNKLHQFQISTIGDAG